MSNKYADERYTPKKPACQPAKSMRLVFNGKFLFFYSNGKLLLYPAVSGTKNQNGKFDYSIERQKLSNKGPIPQGKYWIKPAEIWENAWYKRGSITAWGEYRITIHPFPKTETYQRGGFFIHGGAIPGSIGCIDLTSKITAFINDLENELRDSKQCYIPLFVTYH